MLFMKKPWIIFSVAIVTAIFIYSLSLISKDNQCTWVRSYLCTPSQQTSKQTRIAPLPKVLPSTDIAAQQQAAAAQQAAALAAQQQAATQPVVNTRTRAS